MTVDNYKENILIAINRIDVEDFSISGEEVEYILIANTRANELILETICTISQSDFRKADRLFRNQYDLAVEIIEDIGILLTDENFHLYADEELEFDREKMLKYKIYVL